MIAFGLQFLVQALQPLTGGSVTLRVPRYAFKQHLCDTARKAEQWPRTEPLPWSHSDWLRERDHVRRPKSLQLQDSLLEQGPVTKSSAEGKPAEDV